MNLAEYNQLRKLMAMTASENDGEALGAIRAANRLLARNGLIWKMVFDRLVTVVNPVGGDAEDSGLGDEIFERALRGARGDFRDMLLSIQAQWKNGAELSPRQQAAVLKAAERG